MDRYCCKKPKPLEIGTECCLICEKDMRHKPIFWLSKSQPGILEFDIVTSHKACKNASDRVDKLRQQLLEAEYKLFRITG